MDVEKGSVVSHEAARSASGANGTAASSQPLEKVLAMSKGEGQDSYSKNSAGQAFLVNKYLLTELHEALELVSLPLDQRPMVVADLGCASGMNTVNNMAFIVESLQSRFAATGLSPPLEFQIFFNDLPSNDFNSLFQLLSTDPRTRSESNFFAAGVPGSFYGRLFPSSSVNVFFSSHCLHWLSKIPDVVLDKHSPAYNKGNLWIRNANIVAAAAYKDQASSDMKCFLNARAAELVPGGLLFLFFNGRINFDPNEQIDDPKMQVFWNCVADVWTDMVSEGLLTEEESDTFNIPFYSRTFEEMREDIESCGSAFRVHSVKLCKKEFKFSEIFTTAGPVEIAKKLTGALKAVLNNILESHVGKEVSEIFWQRVEKKVEAILVPAILGPNNQEQEVMSPGLIVSLIRN